MTELCGSGVQKAILESGSEWSENPKLVDTSERGGIQRSIPPGFAYFAVEFDTGGGYLHAIDAESPFSRHFGHVRRALRPDAGMGN